MNEPVAAVKAVVVAFNAAITQQDLDRLRSLMSGDHVFVDPAGAEVVGRDGCLGAWASFFDAFADYRNHFDEIAVHGNVAVAVGHSTCSVPALAGPALWRIEVRDGRVSRWEVAEDAASTRAHLGLGG